MILGRLARTSDACPNCADGGLPRRAAKTRGSSEGARSAEQVSDERTGPTLVGEAAETWRRSSGPSECGAGEQSEPARRVQSQDVIKGRFCADVEFRNWLNGLRRCQFSEQLPDFLFADLAISHSAVRIKIENSWHRADIVIFGQIAQLIHIDFQEFVFSG